MSSKIYGAPYIFHSTNSDTKDGVTLELSFENMTIEGEDVVGTQYTYKELPVPEDEFAVWITGDNGYDEVRVISAGAAMFEGVPYGNYMVQEIDVKAYDSGKGTKVRIGDEYAIVITEDKDFIPKANRSNELGYGLDEEALELDKDKVFIHNIYKATDGDEENNGQQTSGGARTVTSNTLNVNTLSSTEETKTTAPVTEAKDTSSLKEETKTITPVTEVNNTKQQAEENTKTTMPVVESNNTEQEEEKEVDVTIIHSYSDDDYSKEDMVLKNQKVGSSVNAEDYADTDNNNYEITRYETNKVTTVSEDDNTITIYYTRKTVEVTIEYYYDNVMDKEKTRKFTTDVGVVVEGTNRQIERHTKDGYEFSESGLIKIIVSADKENVIRIYYVSNIELDL